MKVLHEVLNCQVPMVQVPFKNWDALQPAGVGVGDIIDSRYIGIFRIIGKLAISNFGNL